MTKMLKRIVRNFFIMLFLPCACWGAVAVNVDYIHSLIRRDWGVDIPYYPSAVNQIANVEYLLKVVDKTNALLNGTATTSYGTDEHYATKQAVDTVATIDAVDRLIVIEPEFFVQTTPDTTSFSFTISAAGIYSIDWGNYKERIIKTDTVPTIYSHDYGTAGTYTIGIGGQANNYSTDGTMAAVSFKANTNIEGISGSLGAIFGTLENGAQPVFYQTFGGCTNLSSTIPETLFSGISGTPIRYMFFGLFEKCTKLTGEIPENLFSGLMGEPREAMFQNTFSECASLSGAIPERLFGGISGAPASHMFSQTFYNCSGLTGPIPENLFGLISGNPAPYMFYATFNGCSKLNGEIPGALFAGVNGAPAEFMFQGLFANCNRLTGSIPETLFAGVQGAPAESMFRSTFYNCSSLSGGLSARLFAGISGTPAKDMYYQTFYGCSGLTENLPSNVFGSIVGRPAEGMYYSTFYNCIRLTGKIPQGLFGDLTDTPATNMFSQTFYNCNKLDGLSARMPDGRFLYDVYGRDLDYGLNMYRNATGLQEYPFIPVKWGGLGVEPKFTVTTTSDTKTFSFKISAQGVFYIDWGDGNYETINKSDTNDTTYTHVYDAAGSYEIGIAGTARNYSENEQFAAISFYANQNVAGISGSLGAIFGTLSDGLQPRFRSTFGGCTNLTGTIPEELFSGITGQPTSFMFTGLFDSCSRLTGTIPERLFSGLSGVPTESLFAITFRACSSLEGSIPERLFSGISGKPTLDLFRSTFESCTGLSGSIPARLFSGISGAPAENMFMGTFFDCSGLTGSIPEGLFGGIYGQPAPGMFMVTFERCARLQNQIPERLFAGISGAPAPRMFRGTFSQCGKLTGPLPDNLFSGISGAPAEDMFMGTFYSDIGIDGDIPVGFFGNLTSAPASGMFVETFMNCNRLSGPSARTSNGDFLYDIYGRDSDYGLDMYKDAVNLDDYEFIPKKWGGLGRVPAEFVVTTTPDTTEFSVNIAAKGDFTIDWGDGTVDEITQTVVTKKTYSHTYSAAGSYSVGLSGQATAYTTSNTSVVSFSESTSVAGISGSLGAIFGTLSDGSQPRFYRTFYNHTNLHGEIPATLFDGITGQPVTAMFYSTFEGCTGLSGEIPSGLFAGLDGTPTIQLFFHTFEGCTGLSGNIPSGLFAGIQGLPAANMFAGTFLNCTGLNGTIPSGLFSGISGAPAANMFNSTFAGCTGLSGAIPSTLFSGISGAPVTNMFTGTFSGCSGLTSIPSNLFAGIQGAPALYMFKETFANCTGLTTIPGALFAGIQGAPASYMFQGTFSGCSNLIALPDDLFAGISGAGKGYMYDATFKNCTGLTGTIPVGYFGDLTETKATYMFRETFLNCAGLTGDSARLLDGRYLYDVYGRTGTYGQNMYQGATGLYDYPFIPTAWGGLGLEPEFYITTTPDTSVFSIYLGAAGNFAINWGDGNTENITKTDTAGATYSHNYDTAGEYLITLSGKATEYPASSNISRVIDFDEYEKIADIEGSLGQIFSTLADGSQPKFANTFAGAVNLTGTIPQYLFHNIRGEPVTYMFYQTFSGCSGLTGSIPSDLFAGIQGAPAESMFNSTFSNCSGLTSIPADLFAGIQGAPARQMFYQTFRNCTSLTSLPEGLFSGISGAVRRSTYAGIFYGCTGLVGEIPLGFFGDITSGIEDAGALGYAFYNCSGLTGPSARLPNGQYLYNVLSIEVGDGMYYGVTGLTDYSSIPADWK